MSDRRHVLVLMTDQHRADGLSCGAHPVVRTPNLDALVADGVRFANAYTTSPVCMPARSSFQTGLYCHNHGQWANHGHLPPGADTFAVRLRRAGYHTAYLGKSHLYSHAGGDHLNRHRPYLHSLGWEDVVEITGPMATVRCDSEMTDHWRRLGCLDTYRDDYARRREVGYPKADWPSPMPPGETADDFVGRTAEQYIGEYDRDQPLLAFVGFGGPHDPWDPPRDWADRYDPSGVDLPIAAGRRGAWIDDTVAQNPRVAEPESGYDETLLRNIRALYYAKISHIDDWIGRICDALRDRGMWDDTAVVFWSDHGEMLGDHHRVHKQTFFESAARVPLIVRPPGGCAAATSDALVSTIDAAATIEPLAGVEPESPLGYGRSLAPLLGSPEDSLRDAVFSEVNCETMIRDARYKLVVGADARSLQLFDLVEDPHEQCNLAGRDDVADVERRLRERMLAWLLATPARCTTNRPPEVETTVDGRYRTQL